MTRAWEGFEQNPDLLHIVIETELTYKIACSNLFIGNFGEMRKYWAKTQDCVKKLQSDQVQMWVDRCNEFEAARTEIEAELRVDRNREDHVD